MNGFATGEDSPSETNNGPHDRVCCLIENGTRCTRQAGNAAYNRRIEKTVQQRLLKLLLDQSVSVSFNFY